MSPNPDQGSDKAPDTQQNKQKLTGQRLLFAAMDDIVRDKPKPATETGASAPTQPKKPNESAEPQTKPRLKYEDKVVGYPDKTSEITDRNSAAYKQILSTLKIKMQNINKREPRHGDIVAAEINNRICTLLIDENSTPKEKIFMANEDILKASLGEEDEAKKVAEKTKGYQEIQEPREVIDKIIKKAVDLFKEQHKNDPLPIEDRARGVQMKDGDTATVYDQNKKYMVVRDGSRSPVPYRVFVQKQAA